MALEITDEKDLVGDVPSASRADKLVVVPRDGTFADALSLMNQYNVQSLPVVDPKQQHKVIGIVSVLDILTRVVFDAVFAAEGPTLTTDALLKLAKEKEDLLTTLTVDKAMGVSEESKTTWKLKSTDDLSQLLNLMSSGVHRCLVTLPKYGDEAEDDNSSFLNYISQRDVLRHLATADRKTEAVKAVLGHHVKGIQHEGVTCVQRGSRALGTFKRMVLENELSAMPIVDKDGKLVDTVSASDIRKLQLKHLQDLLVPIEDFVSSPTSGARVKSERHHVTCTEEDTVAAVLSHLLAARVHRAWVVNDDGLPTGTLSFTDIIRAIYLWTPTSPPAASP